MAWTEEKVVLLKQLWKEGFSGSEIARRMGPYGPTRNAVIGKAHRLGLTNRNTGHDRRRTRTSKPKPALVPSPKKKPVPPPLKAKDIEPLATDDLSILNVKNNQCRWPVDRPGTEGVQFCGKPQDGPNKDGVSSSYCAEHRALGTQESQGRKGNGKWKRT